jgi:prevent-host-death family protein
MLSGTIPTRWKDLLTGAIVGAISRYGDMLMQVKFSSDVVPLSDLKVNPGKIVTQTVETQRPILLTSRGRGVAIVQSLAEYESREEECAFLRAVAQGLTEANEGKTLSIDDAKMRLGII